ncbi:hypothetical protein HWD94_19210 [Pseudarthrobacter equi]|uniref:hypothetical protein n=1 Tax=Pseudarthrobacter equi TaxID=728066 RepID=UPI0021C06359|nr:hypothetical protein [Pseudarthrobacter equi]MCT9627227.1 hypothetical protein [Pseudarthrobacter equi]
MKKRDKILVGGSILCGFLALVLSPIFTWVNDNGDGLSALAAMATGVIAINALRASARDSADRSRPVVVAEFQLAPESDTSTDLVIRNDGATVARNLRVTFDREITTGDAEKDRGADSIKKRYSRTIGVLSPKQELRNTWWFGGSVAGSNKLQNLNPTPDEVIVSLAYEDLGGVQYHDNFELHVDVMLHSTHSFSSTSVRGQLKTMAQELKKISERGPVSPTITTTSSRMTDGSVAQRPIFTEED